MTTEPSSSQHQIPRLAREIDLVDLSVSMFDTAFAIKTAVRIISWLCPAIRTIGFVHASRACNLAAHIPTTRS
jgi:hypothetical protein